MSGGHFNYDQYKIEMIADQVKQIILDNETEEYFNYSAETIEEIENGYNLLRKAAIYAQRIDWLVSGDDGENSFHSRLKEELSEL